MDKQKIRLTNTALHGKEERVKRIFWGCCSALCR